ncbi:regulatory subunit of type II PKA r-subunit domain-containing protein [Ditylenchus destructor]|uniref:Regulatory subunit of type II PKA r-subunit domain-containing protein n=1 Tax=Ditylenchus destructor TaxID=166010 RepID=A0AAD4RC07_9BILA|nr:regulatory subunit of type II PKA r-subunit domain-containing protein [Ditylenchus destructor]
MSSGNEEAQLAQCQAYVRRHNIQQLVKDAIVSLCINKPDNPVLFLREHFDKIYEQRSQRSLVSVKVSYYVRSAANYLS